MESALSDMIKSLLSQLGITETVLAGMLDIRYPTIHSWAIGADQALESEELDRFFRLRGFLLIALKERVKPEHILGLLYEPLDKTDEESRTPLFDIIHDYDSFEKSIGAEIIARYKKEK